MELTDKNKDGILSIITREIEQEMLLQVAKEQLGLRNPGDILLFLAFYTHKYTETNARDGKKYWSLTQHGKEFLADGGFSNEGARNSKEKRIFFVLILAIIVIAALFIWSSYRIF